MDGEDDPTIGEAWRKEGTCGACRHFMTDYGEPPVLYGHCKMYPRTGSRGSSDYACGEFAPLPGFDQTVQIRDSGPTRGDEPRSPRRSGPSGRSGPARRRPARVSGPRIVRRRVGDDGAAVERATALVSDDIVAALTGGESTGATMDSETLRDALLGVVEHFLAVEDCELGNKWVGGTVVIHAGDPDLKPHEIPIDTLFKKVVMVRDRLRVLEQKINSHPTLAATEKAQLQQYISGCYGSLTSFNVLFRDKADKFSSK